MTKQKKRKNGKESKKSYKLLRAGWQVDMDRLNQVSKFKSIRTGIRSKKLLPFLYVKQPFFIVDTGMRIFMIDFDKYYSWKGVKKDA